MYFVYLVIESRRAVEDVISTIPLLRRDAALPAVRHHMSPREFSATIRHRFVAHSSPTAEPLVVWRTTVTDDDGRG